MALIETNEEDYTVMSNIPAHAIEKMRDSLAKYEPKRLIASQFIDYKGDRCVAGVLLPKEQKAPTSRDYFYVMAALGIRFYPDAIVMQNNFFEGTPEQRYGYMLNMLDAELRKRQIHASIPLG